MVHLTEHAVDSILTRMSLEQKIGQVMLIGLDPTETGARYAAMTSQMADLLAELHVGGLVLFERNVGAPLELAELNAAAQAAAVGGGNPPLIISIDQEGGRVTRLRQARGYTEFPSHMALGATGNPRNARQVAAALGRELLAVGINMDLAPVLDVNSNPHNPVIGTRSFGSDPQRVAAFGVEFIQGLQSAGVMAVGKHFPGHGDTGVDSHVSLPTVAHKRSRLEAVEFAPFRAAIDARVAGIMSAHVTFPAIASAAGLPATMSSKVMTELLRNEMGYDGLLITDSLEMGALGRSGYPVPSAAVASLAAGADLLCISHGCTVHRQAHAALMQAVEREEISMARLDAAVRSVLVAKVRYGLLDGKKGGRWNRERVQSSVGSSEAFSLAGRVAEQAITVLRDREHLLPLASKAGDGSLLVVELASRGDFASGALEPVVAGFLMRALDAEGLTLPEDITEDEIREVLGQTPGKTVVLAVANVASHPTQLNLAQALIDAHAPLIVVAIAAPYDFAAMDGAGTCIATYGSNPPLLEALVAVLQGRAEARGRVPVELS
jgi:beta-N-acetylhexosaminidase